MPLWGVGHRVRATGQSGRQVRRQEAVMAWPKEVRMRG